MNKLDESTSSSYKLPKAVVYNAYLETGGGGERSSFEYGLALESLGYEIIYATLPGSKTTLGELFNRFGLPLKNDWRLIEVETEAELEEFVKAEEIELFLNHTFCSYMPNPAKIGLYVVMFPLPTGSKELESINSYQKIICISDFAEIHLKNRWGNSIATKVIPPPVASSHFEQRRQRFDEKEQIILLVGRYNVRGHKKCQLEAISYFADLVENEKIDSSWRLVIAGQVNKSPENDLYVERCKAEALRANVDVLTNISFDELCYLYRRATCLWQFTGIDLAPGEKPEYCEHLGLVAMDCFSYGVIPIVFQRSGVAAFIDYGITGFQFSDRAELGEIMELVCKRFGSHYHLLLFNKILNKAPVFGFSHYREEVTSIVEETRLALFNNTVLL